MKFDFRVGICLAALAISAACSQAAAGPHGPLGCRQARSARRLRADGSTLKVNAPALVSPVDGARAEDRRPTLIWANAHVEIRRHRRGLRHRSEHADGHRVRADRWRIAGLRRAPGRVRYSSSTRCIRGAFARASATTFGPWSSWAEFLSPARPVATVPTVVAGASPRPAPRRCRRMGPGETRKPRPNDSAIVRAVANAFPAALRNSCQEHGGSWEFMDRTD